MTPRMQIQLIGPLRVVTRAGNDATPKARKVRALFGYLAFQLGQSVTRSKIASLLWDRSADVQSLASLRQALVELHSTLADSYPILIHRKGDALRLDLSHCVIDLKKYLDLDLGELPPSGEEWSRICEQPLLEDVDGISSSFDDWLRKIRQDFRDHLQLCCEARLQALKQNGSPSEHVAAAALQLIELEPTNEVGARARMQALSEMGRHSDALKEYQRCIESLRRLLDTAPARETDALHAAIRAAAPGAAWRTPQVHPTATSISTRQPTVVLPTRIAASSRLAPLIGVLPLSYRGQDQTLSVLGELIAEEVIARLAVSPMLRTISRLSTSAVVSEHRRLDEIGALLGAQFIASGGYRVTGDHVSALLELAEVQHQEIVWTGRYEGDVKDFLAPESGITDSICSAMAAAVAATERRRVHRSPLPTLEAYSLQLAGISLIHRPTLAEFRRAYEVLQHLVERFPSSPEPRAWLGQWHVLQVTRGHAQAADVDPSLALDQTKKAIDLSPDCSLALAIEGLVHCHLRGDLDSAETSLRSSLHLNGNEPLAWLFLSMIQVFRSEGEEAWNSAKRAMDLSPLDPMRHYFHGLAAAAALCSHRLEEAIELARSSLAVNAAHVPTWRQLAVALVESGRVSEARAAVAQIRQLHPGFTIASYIKGAPSGGEPFRLRCVPSLRIAGIPEF